MNSWTVARLIGINPRLLLIGATCALLLIAMECWILLLRDPIAEYRGIQNKEKALESTLRHMSASPPALEKVSQEVAALEQRIQGMDLQLPADRLVVGMIGKLDGIAVRHGVALVRVKPGADKDVFMFEEVSFDIELRGKYQSLFDWLRDVETELSNLVITQFEIKPASNLLSINLKAAIYRLKQVGEERK